MKTALWIWRRARLAVLAAVGVFGLLGIAANGCGSAPAASAAETSQTLNIASGSIFLTIDSGVTVSPALVTQWVRQAAINVSRFYGRFPVKSVVIAVAPADDGSVQGGVENDGQRIDIHLGKETTSADLAEDWMLTHEMFHLSQPDVGDDHSWMSEGMADYLEPVARVRIGQITPEKFWQDLVEGMPKGLPAAGDQGLDGTHSWGRTYWGGCLYWMLADVRVRQQTDNRKSVRDAAKAALDAGGDGSQTWTLDRLLDVYDQGTSTVVFKTLHDQMGTRPDPVDLSALWKQLGVIVEGGKVSFDPHAPLAGVRAAITARAEPGDPSLR